MIIDKSIRNQLILDFPNYRIGIMGETYVQFFISNDSDFIVIQLNDCDNYLNFRSKVSEQLHNFKIERENVIRQNYLLIKYLNISYSDIKEINKFERNIYLQLLMNDLTKEENKSSTMGNYKK